MFGKFHILFWFIELFKETTTPTDKKYGSVEHSETFKCLVIEKGSGIFRILLYHFLVAQLLLSLVTHSVTTGKKYRL